MERKLFTPWRIFGHHKLCTSMAKMRRGVWAIINLCFAQAGTNNFQYLNYNDSNYNIIDLFVSLFSVKMILTLSTLTLFLDNSYGTYLRYKTDVTN